MVSPVADPGLVSSQAALARPAPARAPVEESAGISKVLRREVAITAKFGPDPETGSPFQIITGDDVEAAETNDLQRLAKANLGLASPSNALQAQAARSDDELSRQAEASQAGAAAQQSLAASQSSFTSIGGAGTGSSDRGTTVDLRV